MARPCCPSCGWTLVLRTYREVHGVKSDMWEAVCPNPRRAKPCMHRQTETSEGLWTAVWPSEAVGSPEEAALLRRAPAAA